MPSKPRRGSAVAIDSDVIQPSNAQNLPPPSTEGMHKEVEEFWISMINNLEFFLKEEAEGPRRENIIACLHFAREHGYPEDPYCLWAIDGVARCTEVVKFIQISSGNRYYTDNVFACVGGSRWC